MHKLAIALTGATLAVLSLTGCSTTPSDDAKPSAEASPSVTVDANSPRGYIVTAPVVPGQTDTGEALAVGAGDGFEYIHSGNEPKLVLTAQAGGYVCQVKDNMNLDDATAFVNGELSAGVEDFLKEEDGNAFTVTLKDNIAKGEAHRYIAPNKGTGILVSCFGDKGATMVDTAWSWIALNMKVAAVAAAVEGKIAGPSVK